MVGRYNMGSSTRKIQNKIKKIISDSKDNQDISKTIPKVISETMKTKKTKQYFGDKDFGKLISGGISGISALSSGNFNKLYNLDYEVDLNNNKINDDLKVEEIIETILDKIERDEEIENALILTAFKATMAEIIINDLLSPLDFIKKFMCNLLYGLIMENINEALIEFYDGIHTKDFCDKVKTFSSKTIENYMSKSIKDYVEHKIDLNELIEKINNLSESIKEI